MADTENRENSSDEFEDLKDEAIDKAIDKGLGAFSKWVEEKMKENEQHVEKSWGGSESHGSVKLESNIGSAEITIDENHASAQTSANPFIATASAQAAVKKFGANTKVLKIVEANVDGDLFKAEAGANYEAPKGQLGDFQASARAGKITAGVDYIPGASASASVLEAGARAGFGYEFTGYEAGASLAEVQAGPFALRAGFKFGVAIKRGVPEVHAGPITTPGCFIM
ncbi:Oidioi.mRNA.OKI2018_I69.chr1.g995.t1.cds [Oikopleura dioica]|uniref:Oidioi.mRNA.OKI2018_I69.chr1.g995.t1.cds n=1 Tax=Oikopleura dioica TaxID=34765 RepID=A0ABN7SM44_OIKDI|nr:Oidioi.mRNA.OKI2018_I69.chr1.g995.t1.cds [Oikopleura dioica]